MTSLVDRLRYACRYETVTPLVRTYQSCASIGLVLDAASELERLLIENLGLVKTRQRLEDELERLQGRWSDANGHY